MAKSFIELSQNIPGFISVTGDAEITAPVAEAHQDVQPGGIFVARRGLSVDGHDFIPQAVERGAAAVIGEHEIQVQDVPYARVTNAQEATGYLAAAYHDFPSRKLTVIGVTGTDGKTTTSTLMHSILQQSTNGLAGMISTVSAYLGDATVDTGFHVTTPAAPTIQALLAKMVENGLTHCVLEMTSHGLAQGRLNGVDIDAALLTNVTHEHLDYHGTFEAYRAAKARMFELLSTSYRKPEQPKISILNADDPSIDYFAAFPADKVVRYGGDESNDFFLAMAVYDPYQTIFEIGWHNGHILTDSRLLRTSLIGEFNVHNILAAFAAARSLGAALVHIQQGISAVESIPGRMERINEGQPFAAVVDFAHTPNALRNALTATRAMVKKGGRLIAVFGCAGLRDREKRHLMPAVSVKLADCSIFTAEDPRTESLDDILATMADAATAAGGVEGETFIRVPDRGEALLRACQMARKGDVVIACGKGHEQSMAFGTVEYAWDDREAMQAALRGEPLRTLPTAEGE
jgi:UDP-N-acetylmuramoyl-L-alanyl-D-glutamate--2,6-diaminopimelate ligase